MTTNDQIILKQLLEDRKREIAPNISESDYFEIFCAEQIIKDYDPSYDEVEDGIVGAGGDGGIDSLFFLINGEVIHEDTDISIYKGDIAIDLHIIQSKKMSGFSEDAIHRFIASASDILDLSKQVDDLKKTYNAKLLGIIEKFRDGYTRFASKLPKLSLSYYYATVATELHPNVERQVGRLKEVVLSLFSSASFSFDFLDARKLLEIARKQPAVSYTLKLAETPLSAANSFICLVRLANYRAFITDDQGKYRRGIFDANVRDYQGNVEVNRGIRTSLLDPTGEDFWWLNNGITILATDASHSGKTLTIKEPQVVNGLQTSHELFRAFQSATVPSDDRNILVRVIIPQASGSYQRIVRATNSQTNVPRASLRATDPIHRDIEDYLRSKGYYYERRKNYYKNEGRPLDKIVSISYVAQGAMAILMARPNDARARPSTLIKSDQNYQKVFSSKYPIEVYNVCVSLMKLVEEHLRSKQYPANEVNNLKYHISMFIARRSLNNTNLSANKLSKLNLESIDTDLLEDCTLEVSTIFKKLGSDDQVSKGPDFVKALSYRLKETTYKSRLA